MVNLAYVGSKGTDLTVERQLNQLKPLPASENPFVRFPGQARYSKRPRAPFNPNVGHIHWI